MPVHKTTVLDLLRHGEPVGGHRYRGKHDDPLSANGWQQMQAAVAEHHPWQAIVSSPLLRCRAFAEALSVRHNLPCLLDDRLMEIGFGDWEGLTADEVEQAQPGALLRFYADPITHAPLGAEPLTDFQRRIDAVWQDLLQCHAGRHVLVVCHAGVIRMMLALVLELPFSSLFRIKVSHGGMTRLQCDDDGNGAPYCQLLFHGGFVG
ncbi:MAG: histidine phosphatase family protein [Methylococcaceae bacterium]|nr:MAG: histidine phosphatase family protein [Methylococcaceae bacterium]